MEKSQGQLDSKDTCLAMCYVCLEYKVYTLPENYVFDSEGSSFCASCPDCAEETEITIRGLS